MKIIKGDLLELAKQGKFDYIMHGCNCFHKMASGIAGQIAKEFPTAVIVDNTTIAGDIKKLSNYSKAHIAIIKDTPVYFEIINAYTQFRPGPDFNLPALDLVLYKFYHKEIASADKKIVKLGVPWIGCGIGGGDVKQVKPIFTKWSKLIDITVVEYQPNESR